ncbi:MAG: hypothetical protein Ct9H90mP5_04480 [Acidimicrobiaceae bacterium]|nr:MAG: hypothetical protein Ct9H90mP5_04480 [Acidimicrobiaceae bacterium]
MGGKGRRWPFDGEEAWYRLDKSIAGSRRALWGCFPFPETGIMGSLTTNLHMLMASF